MNKALDRSSGTWYVHGMNNKGTNSDDYRSLLLLDEISRNDKLTQRDLSKKLGVALGLVNSYIRNLAAKGYITVSAIPRNRYKYYLTPTGFTEKTRLTYRHLRNFTSLYRVARRDFSALFRGLKDAGTASVVFCGVDEVTEIAYLSLKETGLELIAIVDDEAVGKDFFGLTVAPVNALGARGDVTVVITSFGGGAPFESALTAAGVSPDRMCDISAEGWLKKINNVDVLDDEV
jgi:DNA-binding MarR family transcriptional regulator